MCNTNIFQLVHLWVNSPLASCTSQELHEVLRVTVEGSSLQETQMELPTGVPSWQILLMQQGLSDHKIFIAKRFWKRWLWLLESMPPTSFCESRVFWELCPWGSQRCSSHFGCHWHSQKQHNTPSWWDSEHSIQQYFSAKSSNFQ